MTAIIMLSTHEVAGTVTYIITCNAQNNLVRQAVLALIGK